ncbi:MAG: hypothetical protein A2015_17155 [Spirochaetes bacterium GWF1_31_7]|nr:MAG: hypothetical protein A2Y30_14520 [Spirochaetes bacterium GWE1_32_154]OHD50169.1 MAG: hypothetical protein A2Y29_12565 [Spirochaetes bacterium GWE2_31_10]OHD52483.1 MAG: hypothetical protein A2015_17155 [Spirochaetes bacterium GWF1_31_7]OHD81985.1 MAG: hypothetical protein A2355_02100 [Spirochaetes bacterium RIFOXYB1_FULL_32_8]HBD94128.1 hypothetical protein [Spirochaetia bacterium]
MYNTHRFHFKIDSFLLEEIDKYCVKMNITSREGAINWIFETMLPFINDEIKNPYIIGMCDVAVSVSEDITIKIRDYNFDVIRFLRLRFHSFSFASILRYILRVFLVLKNSVILCLLKESIERNKDVVFSSTEFQTHMVPSKKQNNCILHLDSYYQLIDMTIFYKPPE